MDYVVRKATLGDLDALQQFEQGIVESERPFDSTLKEGRIHYHDLRQLIASPQAEVVVAEISGTAIGCGFANIRSAQPYLKHTQFVYLGCMFVRPDFRRKGVNLAILEALKKWAIEKKIAEIRLEVYEDNVLAKRAYQKAGFKPYMLEMRMEIPLE